MTRKIKGKNKEKEQILTSRMFRDEEKVEVEKPEIDQKEYDELYPDYVAEQDEETKEEVEDIIKATKRDIPISDDVKMDIYNRLVGIQNIANESQMGKFKKIIMLAEECITMLEIDKAEEVKDE